jgi:hypothetical protein
MMPQINQSAISALWVGFSGFSEFVGAGNRVEAEGGIPLLGGFNALDGGGVAATKLG